MGLRTVGLEDLSKAEQRQWLRQKARRAGCPEVLIDELVPELSPEEPVSDRDAYLEHRRMMDAPPLCLKERLLQNAVKHGMSETQAEDWLEESWNQEDPTTAALLALEQRVLELEQQLEWHVDRYQRQWSGKNTNG